MSGVPGIEFDEAIRGITDPALGVVEATDVPGILATPRLADYSAGDRPDLMIVSGPSGSGKDTLITNILRVDPTYQRIQTATSRLQRPGEPEDAYVWLPQAAEDEDEAEYVDRMVEEFELVEHDFHHGNIYGLPLRNLEAIPEGRTGILNTDIAGIKTIRSVLVGSRVLSFFVCPESFEMLIRNMGDSRENVLGRSAVALSYVQEAPVNVEYVIHNRAASDPDEYMTGLAGAVLSLASR